MEDIININWEQYRKITNKCSTCWKVVWNEVHFCSWPDYPWKNYPIHVNQQKTTWNQSCLWDSMPETYPWSWMKIWGLVCPCPKCTIMC